MQYHEAVEETVVGFAIALLIGALIGIEREKKLRAPGEQTATGLRTFILIAQAGAIAAWLSRENDQPLIFAAVAVACGAFILAGYRAGLSAKHFGLTTEFAALVTFLLGGMCLYGYPQLAAGLAIATLVLLAFRDELHGVVERLGWDDIVAGLKLLIVIFIVLPLVPNEPVDPWGVINPYAMTWLVILIAGLSLAGYIVARWLGPRKGTAVTGLAGGLVSSTAVTLALARRSREEEPPGAAATLAGGILLSWAVMFVRVVVECFVVNSSLARQLALPMGIMAAISLSGALLNQRAGVKLRGAQSLQLRNPFSLFFAIKFALLFAAVALLVNRAQELLNERAVYAVAALAGLTDVDAITLSMARESDHERAPVAVTAITIAVLANTLVKTGLAWGLGSSNLRRRVVPTAAVIAAGAVVSILVAR